MYGSTNTFLIPATLLAWLIGKSSICTAFTAPAPVVSIAKIRTAIGSTSPLHAAPPALSSLFDIDASILTAATTIDSTNRDEISLDDAFQDSVSLMDGPVGILLALFGVFAILAVGLKKVMGEMDNAIEKVLEEFESSLKRYYPKRWEDIEENQLEGLTGDARDIKLLQIMEQLQRDEPEFMTKLANRSRDSSPE